MSELILLSFIYITFCLIDLEIYLVFTESARAEITFPNVVKLLFIFAPSFKRFPIAPVDSARSDPARSTRDILLTYQNIQNRYSSQNF